MLGVHTALVRTVQRLLVGVRGYLPPHNFTVSWLRSKSLHLCFEVVCQPETPWKVVGEGSSEGDLFWVPFIKLQVILEAKG
jgi:hypothetical protein